MADKFLNETGLAYYHDRAKTIFENKIEKVKVNGTEQTITNKEVDLSIPTAESNSNHNFIIDDNKTGNDHAILTLNSTGADRGVFVEVQKGDPTGTITRPISAELASIDYVDANGGKIDKIKVNGVEQTITNKEVDLSVPKIGIDKSDEKVSQVVITDADDKGITIEHNTNGAWVYWKDGTTTIDNQKLLASKDYVDSMAAGITGMEFVIVDSLPSTGEKGKIYLVANSGTAPNTYDEYIWVGEGANAKFEKIGTTDIDLSNNWDQTNLEAITTAEIDTLFA